MFPGERRISLFLCDIFLPNERLVAFFLYFVPPFFSLSLNFFFESLKNKKSRFYRGFSISLIFQSQKLSKKMKIFLPNVWKYKNSL
jgi:hypothetical protein